MHVTSKLLTGLLLVGLSATSLFAQEQATQGKDKVDATLPLVLAKGAKMRYEVRVTPTKLTEQRVAKTWTYELEVKEPVNGHWPIGISVIDSSAKASTPAKSESRVQLGCTVDAKGVVREVPASGAAVPHLQRTLDLIFAHGLRAKPLSKGSAMILGAPGPKSSTALTLRYESTAKSDRIAFTISAENKSNPTPASAAGKEVSTKPGKSSGSAVYDSKSGLLQSASIRSESSVYSVKPARTAPAK